VSNKFHSWTADWFFYVILIHWELSSILFLLFAPVIFFVLYNFRLPTNSRTVLITITGYGIAFSLSYILFSLSSFSRWLGLCGLLFFYVPALHMLIKYRNCFLAYIQATFNLVVTFFISMVFAYLASMYYVISPEMFASEQFTIFVERYKTMIGMKIGLIFRNCSPPVLHVSF